GFNDICRTVVLVIGESTLSQPQEGYGLGPGDLWEHSVATGVGARALAERSGFHENVAFTAGLLHDIGKLVLSGSFVGAYAQILKETSENGRSLLETERLLLGLDHAEAGGRILQEWNFPETLIGAVWHHHVPTENGRHQKLASCVHIADLIA